MGNLLEKWNEYIVQGNQLSRELEGFEDIMHVADKPESVIAFYGPAGSGTTFIDSVLSPEKMAEIKSLVVASLTEAKMTKEIELEKLMGIRKPATINPEFEAAVQGMIKEAPVAKEDQTSNPVFRDPNPAAAPELNYEDVRRMYIDEEKTQGDIAKHFKATKSQVNTFLQKNNLFRNNYKKADIFRDAEVEKRRRERP
jgi:hypothetical protein